MRRALYQTTFLFSCLLTALARAQQQQYRDPFNNTYLSTCMSVEDNCAEYQCSDFFNAFANCGLTAISANFTGLSSQLIGQFIQTQGYCSQQLNVDFYKIGNSTINNNTLCAINYINSAYGYFQSNEAIGDLLYGTVDFLLGCVLAVVLGKLICDCLNYYNKPRNEERQALLAAPAAPNYNSVGIQPAAQSSSRAPAPGGDGPALEEVAVQAAAPGSLSFARG